MGTHQEDLTSLPPNSSTQDDTSSTTASTSEMEEPESDDSCKDERRKVPDPAIPVITHAWDGSSGTGKYSDLESGNRRLAEDINAPHGMFVFVPILMILMLVYFVLRKSVQKWNSARSSRSDLPATRERSTRWCE